MTGSLSLALWLLLAPGATESYLGLKTATSIFDDNPEFDGEEQGLEVAGVVENSPAQQVGFQAGDILLRMNGVRLRSDRHLENLIASLPVGTAVHAEVLRGERIIELKTNTVPRLLPRVAAPEVQAFVEVRRFGIVIEDLSAVEATKAGLAAGGGVRVRRILSGANSTIGSKLKAGDVLASLDGETIHGGEDFLALAGALEAGKRVAVGVVAGADRRTVRLRTRDPESYVARFRFPLLVDYRSDRQADETYFGLLPLGLIKYERKENEKKFCLLWVICLTVGNNEVLENLDG